MGLTDELVALDADVALLVYRAEATHGSGEQYSAFASSVYVRGGEGRRRLAFHQQTPHADAAG
jgi:hypothetical protein